jgi:hypothetical protein
MNRARRRWYRRIKKRMFTIAIRWTIFDIDMVFNDRYLEDSEELEREPEIITDCTYYDLAHMITSRLLRIRRTIHESFSAQLLEDNESGQMMIYIRGRTNDQVDSIHRFWSVYLDIPCYVVYTRLYGPAVRIVHYLDHCRYEDNVRISSRIRSMLT